MNPAQRRTYFRLWATACAEQGWSPKDEARRRETTARCMSEIGGPATDSTSDLGDQASLDASARWDTCRADYQTFARARNADWHEERLYGRGKNRLDRNRFRGEAAAFLARLRERSYIPEAGKRRRPIQPCDECEHFVAWGGGNPPPDYNPCALGHKLSFRMPDSREHDAPWGFYRRGCRDRAEISD